MPDITIPLENINDDMVYQGYPKYVSNDSMSKNGRRFVLKMEPTNAEKIHIPGKRRIFVECSC